MPRGPAPQWRARKEPVADNYLLASVDQAGGHGKHHPETGHYAVLIIRGLVNRDEAAEWRRALHRSAVYLHKWGIADIGVSATIKRDGRAYIIEFAAVDKTLARKHVLDKYGPDPGRWPYHPRGRRTA